jgi:hypothetical protein
MSEVYSEVFGGVGGASGGGLTPPQEALIAQIPNKQDKVVPSASGNIQTLNISGNTLDSGKKFNDTGTTANDILSANEVDLRISTAKANDKGYFADLISLQTAFPVGQNGWFAILGTTDTVWIWDATTTNWVDSDKKGQVSSVNSQTGIVVLNQDDIADGTTYKQYSQTEKTKLSGIQTGATANDTDANLKNRANHTGTQTASTISDFSTEARTSVVDDTITDGVVNKSPSQNAVFDALLLKQDKIYDYKDTQASILLIDPVVNNGKTAKAIDSLNEYISNGTIWVLQQQNLSGYEQIANKTTTFQITPDDTHYPSEKLVKDALDLKADIETPYTQTFNATTDWGTASGGKYTITISGTTHNKGVNPQIRIQEDLGSELDNIVEPDDLITNEATGDISFSVPEIPDYRFAGIITVGGSAGGGGAGISSLNGETGLTQTFSTGVSGSDFNINSAGNNHEFNIPTAGLGVRGLVGIGYQTFDGGKTFQNDASSSVMGAGLYNADTADDNGITFNISTDTTGAGAQQQFASTFLSTNFKDHNHATLTAEFGISTYINGTQKTVWYMDENLNLYTDGNLSLNGDFVVNNGSISGGKTINVLSGQGFNQGMNNIGGQINIPAGAPVTGTNIFGTNLAQGFTWSEDMDGGIVPFIGASAVGYVGYMAGQVAGKTIEAITMSVAGLSDAGSVAGAVVNNLNMYVAGGLIGGTPATVNNLRMYWIPSIAGGIATNEWGFINDSANLDNHFEKNLSIGTVAKKPTDATTKLEIAGGDVVTDASNSVYIGLPNVDGSWRYRTDGTDLIYERRESGVWVEKTRITA